MLVYQRVLYIYNFWGKQLKHIFMKSTLPSHDGEKTSSNWWGGHVVPGVNRISRPDRSSADAGGEKKIRDFYGSWNGFMQMCGQFEGFAGIAH